MFASLHTAQLTHRLVQKGGTLARLARFARLALLARTQRKALSRLDDLALADLGLSRDAAQAEAARPIWDVPAIWRN